MTVLDLDFTRQQFPAFSDPDLDGWAFFENAGGSFPCRQVVDRLTDYYASPRLQPRQPYPASQRAAQLMDEGPARLAELLGVDVDELSIGPSTTQNTYVLAQAVREILQPGDTIVVTEQDHEANSGCWRKLAADGITVREWSVDAKTGELSLGGLDAILDESVQVVAFPHASNVVGDINPVRTISDKAHRVGAITVVDSVAFAPHRLPDVTALGADVLLFSTYKTFGPHQGAMVVRRELGQRLPNQGHFFNAANRTKRLVPAGPDHAQVAALAGIADYVDAVHDHHFGADPNSGASAADRADRVGQLWRDHESLLLQPLLDFLADRDDVRLLGPSVAEDRVPTVAIVTEAPPSDLAARLAREHRVMCAGSHFYSYRLMQAIDVDPAKGVLRFSFIHNTSRGDVDQLIAGLAAVL